MFDVDSEQVKVCGKELICLVFTVCYTCNPKFETKDSRKGRAMSVWFYIKSISFSADIY